MAEPHPNSAKDPKARSTTKTPMFRTIGICGGICSGKSTVLKVLKELGARIIDADKVGHACYLPGSDTLKKLQECFGKDIVNKEDGTLNRKKLGGIVFSDKK